MEADSCPCSAGLESSFSGHMQTGMYLPRVCKETDVRQAVYVCVRPCGAGTAREATTQRGGGHGSGQKGGGAQIGADGHRPER